MRSSIPITVFVAMLLSFTTLAVSAQNQPKHEALTEGEIIRLLQGGVSPERVASLARDRGILFQMTPAVESDLRDAGATDALLSELREIAAKAAPPAPAQPPAPSAATTQLVVQTQPGEVQVYVDDVLSGKTSPDGVLKIPNLPAGTHRVRLALTGYQDFQQRIDLPAGETTHYAFALVAAQPAAPTPGAIVHFIFDRTLETPVQPVRGLALGGDPATLAALGPDGNVRMWNAVTGNPLKTIALYDRPKGVSCMAFSRDGKWIVVSEFFVKAKVYTSKAELLDAAAGQEVRTLVSHHWEIDGVAISRDGHWFATSNWDRKVRLLEFPSGKEVRDFESAGKPRCVAISPDAKIIASGGLDATVSLWDCQGGSEIRRLSGHTGGVVGVDFSPDGRQLASASSDGSVRIWNVATGQSLSTLSGHMGAVTSAVYSPDGKFVVSGGADNTVRFWDPATGRNVETFGGHSGVWQVAFSPDGKFLAAGHADGTISVWKKKE
jgi:WD40 repeat protein